MNLRAISGLKIYVIAYVWAGITVIIPLINEGYPFNLKRLFLMDEYKGITYYYYKYYFSILLF